VHLAVPIEDDPTRSLQLIGTPGVNSSILAMVNMVEGTPLVANWVAPVSSTAVRPANDITSGARRI
jgi:hypothetical protein